MDKSEPYLLVVEVKLYSTSYKVNVRFPNIRLTFNIEVPEHEITDFLIATSVYRRCKSSQLTVTVPSKALFGKCALDLTPALFCSVSLQKNKTVFAVS